jgi:hypothetical protein
LGIGPNPQSPIPNPQSPLYKNNVTNNYYNLNIFDEIANPLIKPKINKN